MANRMEIQTKGLEELIGRIDKAGGDMKAAVNQALTKGKEAVQPDIEEAIRRHRRTGRTEASLDNDMRVAWDGTVGSIDIGFHIRKGGLPSIFLMYGTPRIQPDKKLYNAVYGPTARRKAKEAEEEALRGFMKKLTGG